MKKEKIKLNDIKIESFITKLDQNEKATLDGAQNSGYWLCSLWVSGCLLTHNCNASHDVIFSND